MRRIATGDGIDAAADLFGAGNAGYTNGSVPATPATIVDQLAMNIFQEELVRVVTNHGQTLDQATTNIATHNKEQVWRALVGMGESGGRTMFYPTEGDGAVDEYVDTIKAFTFSQGAAQRIIAAIQVPDKYVAGSKLDLTWGWWAKATSGNVDWDVSVSLVRVGTDAVASPGATSSPSVGAVTLDSPSGEYRQTTATIIDTSGQIGGVAVTAGSLVIVVIQRASTDTATVDAYIAQNSIQKKFV